MTKPPVAFISASVVQRLSLPCAPNTPIYLGDTNLAHMRSKHPNDYTKYAQHIPAILSTPDYVGINRKDNSIEFVKEFKMDNDYVKVAVRISKSGIYFARSLYVLNTKRVQNFINKGTLLPV